MRLFTPTERRIIAILLTGSKTLSEIAEKMNLSKPGTSKYLKNLEHEGFLRGNYERTTEGRTIRYRLLPVHVLVSVDPESETVISFHVDDVFDPDFPLLGSIPQKEFRQELKFFLIEFTKKRIQDVTIILYGSVATGAATRKSDIDLLFVKEMWTHQEKEICLNAIATTSEQLAHPIKPQFFTLETFDEIDVALQKEIKDQGVVIFESGRSWRRLQGQLKTYRTIML
jgi:DNA-binding Lrp family transcriptional regulator